MNRVPLKIGCKRSPSHGISLSKHYHIDDKFVRVDYFVASDSQARGWIFPGFLFLSYFRSDVYCLLMDRYQIHCGRLETVLHSVRDAVLSNRAIDCICYRKSLEALARRKSEEESLEDILTTTGYIVADMEAVQSAESLSCDHPRGTGYYPGKYRGYGSYRSLRMIQERRSIRALATEVRKRRPQTVVEIGSGRGGTFYLWCRYLESATTFLSIDYSLVNRQNEFWSHFSIGDEIRCIEGNSHDDRTVKAVRRALDGDEIDFLYIDGDHSREGVERDFRLYEPLLSEDGVIALHDIRNETTGVPEFWEDIRRSYSTEEFGEKVFKNGMVYL